MTNIRVNQPHEKTLVRLGVFELQLFLQNKAIGSILKEED